MRIAIVCLIACILLTGCSKKEKGYADDVPCSELMDSVEDQIPVNFGYETFGGEHIQFYFEDTELPDDLCLRYSALSEDINEVGIFHASTEEDRKKIEALSEDYLKNLLEEKRAFIASYAPEELPKLENAEVRSFGNYTVYAILDDDDRELVFETVEKLVTKK